MGSTARGTARGALGPNQLRLQEERGENTLPGFIPADQYLDPADRYSSFPKKAGSRHNVGEPIQGLQTCEGSWLLLAWLKFTAKRSPDDKPFSAVRVICFLSNLSFFSRKWLMPLTFETQTQHPAAARLQDPRAERCQRGASPGGSVSQHHRLGGLGGGCSFPTAPSRSISGMSGPTEATTLKPQSCSCITELAGKGMAPGGTTGLGASRSAPGSG